jgi:hypothetical protein
VTVEAGISGRGLLEAARTPVRILGAEREIRRALDAEARLGRLADLGSLLAEGGRRHFDGLVRTASGPAEPRRHAAPVPPPRLKRDVGGRVVEGGPYVPGHSYVTE